MQDRIVPHLSNWEVIGLWVSPRSKMTSLYEPPKIPEVGAWIKFREHPAPTWCQPMPAVLPP